MSRLRVTLVSLVFSLFTLSILALPAFAVTSASRPAFSGNHARAVMPLPLAPMHARVEGANVNGTWSGNVNITINCDSGGTLTAPIGLSLALQDSNDVVLGSVSLSNVPNAGSSCQASSTLPPLSGPATGSVNGSTLSLSAALPGDKGTTFTVSITGSVSGTSMSISGGGQGATFSGTITQTSGSSPDTTLSGVWSGTADGTFIPCGILAPVHTSMSLSGSILQVGNTFTGNFLVTGGKSDHLENGNCTVIDAPPGSTVVSGTLNGTAISGTYVDIGKTNGPHAFSGTVAGNAITINFVGDYSGEFAVATLTRAGGGTGTTSSPLILSFGASRLSVTPGQSSTLSWSTFNSTGVSIDHGVGAQAASGTVDVRPSATTTYILTAQGSGGVSTSAAVTIEVVANPQVIISAMPRGMLTVPGSTASDEFTITNNGGSDAEVSIGITGSNFSASPLSLTLAAGGSAVVVVHGTASSAGTFNGTATVSTAGTQQQTSVPLSLLVASPPAASVIPKATAPRVEVAGPPGQNPSGSVQFTNSGLAALQGIAVADVPWISVQSGLITIAPGATTSVNFNIDRSQRPDAGLGGAAGSITLLYLGNASAKIGAALGTTPVNSVSVTIVDVVKPAAVAGAPSPVGPGELAYVITGLTSNGSRAGDLFFSSRSTAPSISDLKIYFTPGASGTTKLTTALPSFTPDTSIAFPSILKNVFGAFPSGAPIQLRTTDAPNLSVAALLSALRTDGLGVRQSAIPVLWSDRTAGAGERIVLPGPAANAASNIGTRVFAQEMSGSTGSVQFDYYDASGKQLAGGGAVQINPFAAIQDDAPDGTTCVVLTNTATNGSRLAGYTLVHNDASPGGMWAVVDPSRAAGVPVDKMVMPLAASGAGVQQDLFVTNGSTSAAAVSVAVIAANGRRHVVRTTSTDAAALGTQGYTINPLNTQQIALGASSGYVLVTAPAGSVSVAGRLIAPERNGQYQTGLPAVAVASSLGASQTKRFSGVDDASPASASNGVQQTYRTSLILIETAGQPATVHVTLRYSFASGTVTSSQASASRDFAVAPGQMFVVADLARSVIGLQRDAFGDLRNMLVDVSVDGSGKVVPFIESTDNATGDVSVRSE